MFQWRSPQESIQAPVLVVYMDDDSHEKLRQTGMIAWDRHLHAQLLRQLKRLGARAVVFDVLFRPPADAPATQDLLDAAKEFGPVFFGAHRDSTTVPTGEHKYWRVIAPALDLTPPLSYGLVEEADEERAPREHVTPLLGVEPISWKVARAVMENPPVPATRRRWIHYYGTADCLPHASYVSVLSNSFPRSLSFSNRVVYVGSGVKTGYTRGIDTDFFRTPYSEKFPGVALNAMVMVNLYRGDWLSRIPAFWELLFLACFGLVAGRGFFVWSSAKAIGFAILLELALLGMAYALFSADLWFCWLIPSCVLVPVGLLASIALENGRVRREVGQLSSVKDIRPAVPGAAALIGSPSRGAMPVSSPEEDRTVVGAPEILEIPNYQLLRLIGKGGYGEVWVAKNAVGVLHAMKIIHRSAFQTAEPFEREFRGVQNYMPISLGHPGLVPVLYVGREEKLGCFYYAMELADDVNSDAAVDPERYMPRSLDHELLVRGPLSAKESIEIGMRLAETLDYIHRQKLVHRDIKPSNVIFVRGQPKFADLGLVTTSHESRSARGESSTVLYVGTRGYMPPEGSGTPAADVYSLGKVIYEMVVGKNAHQFPTLPTDLAQRPDGDDLLKLDPILLKACEPRVSDRFANAGELHQALMELFKAIKS